MALTLRESSADVSTGTTASSPTVLSTFSGLGGLDLGLEGAGFRCVGCIEWDEYARLSLKANRDGAWPILEPGNIAEVAETLIPSDVGLKPGELTLLAGAPPCQPFSKAAQWSRGSRAGLDDPRAAFLGDLMELVRRFLPRVVLIENVSGFIRGTTSALPYLAERVADIRTRSGVDYRIEFRICDAADYGVPQKRTRAIVVLLRGSQEFAWPKATHATNPATAWDAIGHEAPTGADVPKPAGKWATLLASIPEGHNYLWHTPRGGGEPIFGYRSRYWSFLLKLARDKPSWTLPASPGPGTGPFHWENRPLAVWELLRLQSFPLDWVVEGPHREKVRQVGNATPVLLGEVLGRAVLRSLGITVLAELRYEVPRRGNPPPPAPPRAMPEGFLHLRGAHPDHPGAGKGPRPRHESTAT